MSNSIAANFHDELKNWEQTLIQYSESIIALERKLYTIIEHDTIPNLAQDAEDLLNQLTLLRIDIGSLFQNIVEQETQLKKNNTPLENDALSQQAKNNQEMIRKKMNQTGKDFLDQEYECEQFLKDK